MYIQIALLYFEERSFTILAYYVTYKACADSPDV